MVKKQTAHQNLSNLPVSEQSSALPHITLPTAFYFLWSEKESTTGTTFQFPSDACIFDNLYAI